MTNDLFYYFVMFYQVFIYEFTNNYSDINDYFHEYNTRDT